MNWEHAATASYADNGAVVIKTEDGWQVYPFGAEGGPTPGYPDRKTAVQACEGIIADGVCCGFTDDDH